MQASQNPFGLSTPQTNLIHRQTGLPNRFMDHIRNFGRKSNYTHETLSQLNGDESHRNPLGTFSQIYKQDRAVNCCEGAETPLADGRRAADCGSPRPSSNNQQASSVMMLRALKTPNYDI